MANSLKPVTHCIFDMDGTLLDTEKLYTEIVQSILDEYGKTYTWEMKLSIMGTPALDGAKKIVDHYNLPITAEEYVKTQAERASAMMMNATLMPGVKRLLQHLHKHNVPICLATSSDEEILKVKRTNHDEVFRLFHHLVCGGSDAEVKKGKPAPDIFLIAASRFDDKPSPENCLVFEDAPNGVQAAHGAGMQCVMIPEPHVPVEMRELATIVLDSMENFQPEKFNLPAFD